MRARPERPRAPSFVTCGVVACWVTLGLVAMGFSNGSALAQAEPGVALPEISAPVTDRADVLSPAFEAELGERLRAHHEATGAQLAVLVVATTGQESIEAFALGVASRWQGGAAGDDGGTLFVLAVHDRRMRLETGYGLEDTLTDGRVARILSGAV